MNRKRIIYVPGNQNDGYCRLYFGYQIIPLYYYIQKVIEHSSYILITNIMETGTKFYIMRTFEKQVQKWNI